MRKIVAISCLAAMTGFYSCKEVPVLIAKDVPGQEDTTYVVSNIETPQDKKYLIEELSGVKCVNCPAGILKLNDMSTNGEFANKLTIVSIHVGTFTDVIKDKPGYNSKQDFVVNGSSQLLEIVLGGEPGKPCASFDRLKISNQYNLLLPNYPQWSSYMSSARDSSTTSPVNIHIETAEGKTQDEFDIKVKLHYTENLTAKQSLNIYLVENNMRDAMQYAGERIDTNYIFNHVLRKYITPPTGKRILSDVAVEKGRVYELRTKLTIDRNDKAQSFWNPENMEVVVFVSSADENSKRVYQSQYVHLKP